MNINVATWARIIKRSQPNEHQHSNTSSLSSGGSVVRPSSLSSTRPLPLNLVTSPASVSLPPPSTSSNSSPPPQQLDSHSAAVDSPHVSSPQENNSHRQLEQTTSEKPQHYHHPHPPHSHHPNVHPVLSSGMAGTSMARPLSLSLSSPVVPMALAAAGGSRDVVTSPVTPTALTSTIVPIQFPPSGKKPAPPPPPRTTSVVTIGHTTPVGQPSGPPPQPVPRSYHHNITPSDTVEDAKVRRPFVQFFFVSYLSTFPFVFIPDSPPFFT